MSFSFRHQSASDASPQMQLTRHDPQRCTITAPDFIPLAIRFRPHDF
jgi:hypothetical protein